MSQLEGFGVRSMGGLRVCDGMKELEDGEDMSGGDMGGRDMRGGRREWRIVMRVYTTMICVSGGVISCVAWQQW